MPPRQNDQVPKHLKGTNSGTLVQSKGKLLCFVYFFSRVAHHCSWPAPKWCHFSPASLPPEWRHVLFTSGIANLSLYKHWEQYSWYKSQAVLSTVLIYLYINIVRSVSAGNTKGGSITVLLTSCLTGLDQSVLQIKTKIVSIHTADSKPVKQEVNVTVILPPLVFPGQWQKRKV